MKNRDFLGEYNLDELARSSGWTSRKSGKVAVREFRLAMIEATSIPNDSLRLVAFLSHATSSISASKQAIRKMNQRAGTRVVRSSLRAGRGGQGQARPVRPGLGVKAHSRSGQHLDRPAQAPVRGFRGSGERRGQASKRLLALQEWQIYLTACDSPALSLQNAYELYRQRWSIEILFKAFKSHMRIDQIPAYASESMVRCLVLWALIRIARSFVVVLPILEEALDRASVSLLKLYSLIEALALDLSPFYFENPSNLETFLKHCRYEKRKRVSLPANLKVLSLG